MAVANIDTVYQRVLALANKEQRGYITPQEFNLLAGKAQNDIFEMYFHDYKTALLSPGNQSKSSDDIDMIREKIAMHRVIGGTIDSGSIPADTHWLESVYKDIKKSRVVTWTAPSETDIANTNVYTSLSRLDLRAHYDGDGFESVGEGKYYILFVHEDSTIDLNYIQTNNEQFIRVLETYSSTQVAMKVVEAINDGSPYHSATRDGDVLTITYLQDRDFNTAESTSALAGFDPTVAVTSVADYANFEEVNKDDWNYIRSSKKLNPNKNSRGIFHRVGSTGISILPDPGADTVLCDYIKRPADPKWGYVVVGDKALYDSGNTIPLELHASEESTLTNKILELAGIVINKPGLSEVILRNEAVKEANENK